MNAQELRIEDIHVGDTASFSRTWTNEDVENFAKISGDTNPLHLNDEYAQTTIFGKRLVHGMLLGSLCSQFVGMHIPGKHCLYLSQSLSFKKPVFIGDTIIVTGTVTAVSESTKIITIAITMTKEDVEVVAGEAKAQVL